MLCPNRMAFFKKFGLILKDYCLNSTLAGLSYIADSRFHYTERVFWLLCLLASIYGSYFLIRQTLIDFDESSVSMVVETAGLGDQMQFPSIGVCEIGNTKDFYSELDTLIKSWRKSEDEDYNFDVEDFLLRVIFHNLYNFGSYVSYCAPYQNCPDDCVKCPESNYSSLAQLVRRNCSQLITKCVFNGESFPCCDYFLPIQTTLGRCFLLNSIQLTERNGKHWLPMNIGGEETASVLHLEFSKATSVSILNEEDIPHMLLTTLHFNQQHEKTVQEILLAVQNVVNDDGVRDIDRHVRKCIFPDEKFLRTTYKYYSYTVCVTECLKRYQLVLCKCTHFNLINGDKDKSPQCDYKGLTCLDKHDLVFPQTTIMQPWRSNGLRCDCLPSCSEHEIKSVGRTYTAVPDDQPKTRITRIVMQSISTQRYRRQAVRNNLDIVVSIGGIMGLFLGFSILSAVELFYFFMIRVCKNKYQTHLDT